MVALATPGKTAHYVGNWTVNLSGTSSSAPLTIEPALSVSNPVLDGNFGKGSGCGTAACNGPVLTVGTPTGQLNAAETAAPPQAGTPSLNVFLHLQGITVEDANSGPNGSTGGEAGAVMISRGAHLAVKNSLFLHNHASDGGAIDNALAGTVTVTNSRLEANTATYGGGAINNATHGSGTLAVSGSTFSHNSANAGGAIENAWEGVGTTAVTNSTFLYNAAVVAVPSPGAITEGGAIDDGTRGTTALTVTGSTFVGNVVKNETERGVGGGGAIDIADGGANSASYSVSGSTFIANSAHYGGAINVGKATGTVARSTFSANSAAYGGALANSITQGLGSLTVSASTFSANRASGNGGAINNAEGTGPGTLTVSASTFWGNAALGKDNTSGVDSNVTNGDGGAIDNADNGGIGTAVVSASTFSGNVAKHAGGTVANDGTLFAAADIFNGSCYESSSQTEWADQGYNVGANGTCLNGGTADVSHGAGRLDPLARRGGPAKTMRPLAASPAVGIVPLNTAVMLNGDPAMLCPTTDQRGVPSAAGKACNAGAVQAT